jgi:hypothetical protein
MAKIKTTDKYNADVDTVFKHFTDSDFIKARAEAIGGRNVDVQVEDKGDTVVLTVNREIRSDAPSALKKFVPEWSHSTQVETWKVKPGGPYMGKATVDVDGVPVSVRSRMKLAAGKNGGSVMLIETETSSSVPLVGGKLASFAAGTAEETLKAEYQFNKKQIDG